MPVSWPSPRPKPTPAEVSPDSVEVDPDVVLGHDGKVYRALTVERIDLHCRDVRDRIQKVRGDVKELYKNDMDKLLEHRLYLSMCTADTA